jgi:hypothetical protein
VLIAGGALTAFISGTEGDTATNSGGNFLVRSAHRFMNAGYRVITMDRPDDFTRYGDIDGASYLYDVYRTSVDHAIDITTIVNQENSDNLPVFIAGTSRGAISAVAQNMLAMGIALSSPVTRSRAGGTPIGSAALPVDVVEVPAHVLYHQNDGCGGTQPTNTAALIEQFANAEVEVVGNHVADGFVDTVANNPCGAFSFHGFLGIENCAVNTTTTWIDDFLDAIETANPGNARPIAQGQTISTVESHALDIVLTATDADDTNLTFALPYTQTSLGGTVSLNGSTVHYEPPQVTVDTMDSFVFTVIDVKGSRSAAVVNVNIITQGTFNHALVAGQACVTCHEKIIITGNSVTHPITSNLCEACHTTVSWRQFLLPFDHDQTTDLCENCHDGTIASGKGANHIVTTLACDSCHTTTGWLTIVTP